MRDFIAFVYKEFYHILRDKRTMLILLVMPIVMIVIFGFAISTEIRNAVLPKMVIAYPLLIMLVMPLITTMDVKDIKLTIVDNNHSTTSKNLIDKIGASDYFILETL